MKQHSHSAKRRKPRDGRIWILSPGEGARWWADHLKSGIAALGWPKLGDVESYSNSDEVKDDYRENYPDRNPNSSQPMMVWRWMDEVQPGDLIVSRRGKSEVIGIGRVTSEYSYRPERSEDPQVREVDWLLDGEWKLPENGRSFTQATFVELKKSSPRIAVLNKLLGVDLLELLDNPEMTVREPQRFFWLNASLKMWDAAKMDVGQEQSYTRLNEDGKPRRLAGAFEAIKAGDFLVSCRTGGSERGALTSIFRATSGVRDRDGGKGGRFTFVKLCDLPAEVAQEELHAHPNFDPLFTSQPSIHSGNAQGSLFEIERGAFELILQIGGTSLGALVDPLSEAETLPALTPFSIDQIADSFFDKTELKKTYARWLDKKNLILTGPPGTGKSFNATQLAWSICGSKPTRGNDHPHVKRLQFHQSTSYEDFISGYKPESGGGFALKKGVFFNFCIEAAKNPSKNYVLVIDEINRGNISRIFGELLYLIEADKRGSENSLQLATQPDEEAQAPAGAILPTWQRFFVPKNVYILGMMNTADRSLAGFDNALRRRFIFFDMQPQFDSEVFKKEFDDQVLASRIGSAMAALNKAIGDDPMLGEGFTVGHSYFCKYDNQADANKWLQEVLAYEIEPLLKEYWFGDLSAKGKEHIARLRQDLGLQVKDE